MNGPTRSTTGLFPTWNTLEYTIKIQKAQMKDGKSDNSFLSGKITIDDNSEYEDYEAAATKLVKETNSSILL